MKLSLTMICKSELENLKRLYPLVKDYIDEWVVVIPPKDSAIPFLKGKAKVIEQDFTQGIEPEIIEKMRDWGVEVDPDYRIFNFAAARNASLKAATGDYILWLDADDEPVGLENVKEFVQANPETDCFHMIYDYSRDEYGNSEADHTRERIIKNNGIFEWRGSELGLIHETLIEKPGKTYLRLDFPKDTYVKHLSDHIAESSERNFIALLYEYIKTEGKDPRNTYYLGIEFFNRQMFGKCIQVLMEFIKESGSQEDRYHAWVKIAEAYHKLGDSKSGRDAYLAGIDEMPNYPHAYLGLGESYHKEENWVKSTDFILTGLNKKMPGIKHGLDKLRFTFWPAGYLALNFLQIGKPMDAYKWFSIAAKLNPRHPWIQENVQLFQDAKNLDEYVRSFVKLGQLSQKLYPKTLSKLAEAVPDELMDQELLMDFKWRYTRPKVWSDKSIVFWCSSAFEDWGPESLEKGCGGSEEAVIQITKQLVKLGWEVTVYNNCIREQVKDGVNWVRFERFNPRDIFNVIVSWRNNVFTDKIVANKKYIDMHDVAEKTFYTPEMVGDAKLLFKSKYHRNLYPDLPEEQCVIIPNGIDLAQFTGPKKTKNNMVWTSSYDRGLENLLEVWSDIKKEIPDVTLDTYYGFNLYDTTPWGRTEKGQLWKQWMIELLKQDGVTDHGRVGTSEIAEAYNKADVFPYPSMFPEIDMISLTKAMAARCVPITTNFAAVKERNQGIGVEVDPYTPEGREQFKNELIALLKDDKRKEEIRSKLDVSNYDWDEISKRWETEFRK